MQIFRFKRTQTFANLRLSRFQRRTFLSFFFLTNQDLTLLMNYFFFCELFAKYKMHQTLAQLELWENYENYDNKVYMLPKQLDEKVARLHLAKIGVELETLTQEQAEYIGVTVEGPYKPEYYRY